MMTVVARSGELGYLNRMTRGFLMFGSLWRKWVLRFALLSFVGLYSLGLLPHHHAAVADDLNCPVCHAVNSLTNLAGDSSPPGFQFTSFVLQLLLVLAWAPAVVARNDKLLLLKHPRAPPSVS